MCGLFLAVLATLPLQAAADSARCLPPDGTDGAQPEPAMERLAEALTGLQQVPVTGPAFAGIIRESGISFCLQAPMPDCRGFFSPDENRIVLRPELNAAAMQLVMVHELRHVWQYGRGYRPAPHLDRRENARLVFAAEADAQAIATLHGWMARETDPALWERLSEFPLYSDITEAFAEAQDAGAEPEQAVLAAFRQWYVSYWRTMSYYRSSCAEQLDLQDRLKLEPGYGFLPEDYFEGLCLMPGGSDYGCADTPELKRLPEFGGPHQ